MKINELKKEYANQDNRGTAFPIYVTVQELVYIGVIAEGCSESCPYGDGETKLEHNCELCMEYPCWDEENAAENEPDHCDEDVRCGYIWHDIEPFLTIKGAEEFIKADAHNHGRLRAYVHCFERRNHEMRGLLAELGFKVKD